MTSSSAFRDATGGPATTSDDLRFRRLRLKNWKNFLDVDIPVHDRMFLVGANGSGKSNLLNAFRFLRDVASPGGGLETAVAKRGGLTAIRCLAAAHDAQVGIEVEMEDQDGASRWRYGLAFHDVSGQPRLCREHVACNGRTVVERPDANDRHDSTLLTQTHMEHVALNRAFGSIGNLFKSVCYMHAVPQIVRQRTLWDGGTQYAFGGELIDQIAATEEPVRADLLVRLENALRIAVPHLESLALVRDAVGKPHFRVRLDLWRPDVYQTEAEMSDGTLRLIALLWTVMRSKGPLLLEEPELYLHPDLVRYLILVFESVRRDTIRQLFVSSHSMDFLGDSDIGLDETVLLMGDDGRTRVVRASEMQQARILSEHGHSVAEVAYPHTQPRDLTRMANVLRGEDDREAVT